MASEEKRRPKPDELKKIDKLPVNSAGEVDVPEEVAIGQAQDMFGDKIYGLMEEVSKEVEDAFADGLKDSLLEKIGKIGETLKEQVAKEVIAPVSEARGLAKGAAQKIEKNAAAEIDRKVEKIAGTYEQEKKIADAAYEKECAAASSDSERAVAAEKRDAAMEKAAANAKKKLEETIRQTLEEKPAAVIREADTVKAMEEKNGVENAIRAHLRGFARTIPSFIMAYGNRDLKLSNFENYVSPDVFREVTGITIDNFLFLRDGGDYLDEQTGKTKTFKGHLFDEVIFDGAVKEFLDKKEELKDYFREGLDEDIFDYIPPQKTNQIFTPRNVVSLMVDRLEKENPGCFDDPARTFADLYMKSGLYITEIVKRLFRSEGLKKAFPDDDERIRHILEKQVFGMAPTEIIYRIATNYILGFDEEMRNLSHNFRLADAVSAAKAGRLDEVVEKAFRE